MHYSIYQYLKTSLHSAIQKAYPQQYPHLESIPITFSSITSDPLTDIATPYPLKISQLLGLPVAAVSQQILDQFQINRDYLSNTADNLFCRGFFNFRLSDKLLLQSVYHTSIIDNTLNNVLIKSDHEIINKIRLLLQKSEPENLPSLDVFINWLLPHSTSEYKSARLIALSSLDGIHSAKTGDYFKRRLLDEAKNFYRRCPMQTDDYQLSMQRFLIIKAIYIRISQVTSIAFRKINVASQPL
jgi:arginyl-tRNA synthetase